MKEFQIVKLEEDPDWKEGSRCTKSAVGAGGGGGWEQGAGCGCCSKYNQDITDVWRKAPSGRMACSIRRGHLDNL